MRSFVHELLVPLAPHGTRSTMRQEWRNFCVCTVSRPYAKTTRTTKKAPKRHLYASRFFRLILVIPLIFVAFDAAATWLTKHLHLCIIRTLAQHNISSTIKQPCRGFE